MEVDGHIRKFLNETYNRPRRCAGQRHPLKMVFSRKFSGNLTGQWREKIGHREARLLDIAVTKRFARQETSGRHRQSQPKGWVGGRSAMEKAVRQASKLPELGRPWVDQNAIGGKKNQGHEILPLSARRDEKERNNKNRQVETVNRVSPW